MQARERFEDIDKSLIFLLSEQPCTAIIDEGSWPGIHVFLVILFEEHSTSKPTAKGRSSIIHPTL